MGRKLATVFGACILSMSAQTPQVPAGGAPLTITFADALDRARRFGPGIQSATLAALLATEDRIQAKAALLPQTGFFNQFIYTQPNGSPSGVFVANDGPHVYSSQAQVHEDLSPARHAEYRRALAAEALAKAQADVALRGLLATLIQDYYALAATQRKIVNARQGLADARSFQDITEKQERGGEAAHADVVKAQLQTEQRQRDLAEAQLAIEKARLALAILIFPGFRTDFNVVDDLDTAPPLPSFDDVSRQAAEKNPELRAAQAAIRQEEAGITAARAGDLPSLTLDYFFGINANEVAIYNRDHLNNIGSSAQATLTIPLWTWGAARSKVRQAELRRQQAQVELTVTQRELLSNLNSFYAEAQAANAQLASLRRSVTLAEESLRLTILRYEAGESTALEVVDAQTTLLQARNSYADGLVRYRVAAGTLQSYTGSL